MGTTATLGVARLGPSGAFLAEDAREGAPTVLLLGPEIPPGTQVGDRLEVFVYLDSEARPLATTRTPKVALGEVAFLEVTALTDVGAFVDWGLPKDLLLPFAEQTVTPEIGARYAVALYVDSSGRLAGTMRVSERLRGRPRAHLRGAASRLAAGAWVDGVAWRDDPDRGLFVVCERRWVGLVPSHEPHALAPGEAARFRVTNILQDGKVELSLRAVAHEAQGADAEALLAALARPGAPRVGDHTSPEEIRDRFGLSKKAFKRAAGRLLRDGRLVVDDRGDFRVAGAPPPRRRRAP